MVQMNLIAGRDRDADTEKRLGTQQGQERWDELRDRQRVGSGCAAQRPQLSVCDGCRAGSGLGDPRGTGSMYTSS